MLAVEIHQQARTSSDISFFLQLLGVPTIIRNQSPLVAITNPTNDQYFIAPLGITIDVEASDPDGSVMKVELLADGVSVGQTTHSPYRFTWNAPPIGAHVLTALAMDNEGATATSRAPRLHDRRSTAPHHPA